MPLGFQRLNEKQQRPSPHVNFIKPLSGPDHDTAHDFLSRIAAISVPIQRVNLINVMSLEEFPPNREFWGRNFNNGECIQLILRSPSTGQWLPFRFVQMVYMHELAHVHQMNHGREFWKLKNKYSEELKELWGKGYEGEGLWGRGRNLYNGQIADDAGLPAADQEAVRQTCGGTYRGLRGRGKRRRPDRPQLNYAERQAKRIQEKFGDKGEAHTLGDDAQTRTTLEKGKKVKGKPRVAGSNRGRELRAAAALARFDTPKPESSVEPEEDTVSDYETDYGSDFDETTAAKGANGQNLLDAEGKRLVRVCEGVDDEDDEDARRELEELVGITKTGGSAGPTKEPAKTIIDLDEADISTASEAEDDPKASTPATTASATSSKSENVDKCREADKDSSATKELEPITSKLKPASAPLKTPKPTEKPSEAARPEQQYANGVQESSDECPVCSLQNEADSLTCLACSNVLHPERLPNHWRCESDACTGSLYVNAGDAGLCGICMNPKP